MQVNPHIYDVAYTRPDTRGQSAARLVRYLTRRPDDKERPGPESEWHSLPDEQVFGSPEAFKRAANRRQRERVESARRRDKDLGQDHSPQNVSYVHVVISPSSREAFRDEDWGALVGPWVRDRKGRPCAYMGAVHYDDPEGPKLHLAIARDRIHKTKELPQLKEMTAELIREREDLLEHERYPEQVRENDRQPEHEARREATMQDHQQQAEAEEMSQQQAEEEAQRGQESHREEGQRTEERQTAERRRRREEREAREREEDEHEREM